MRRLLQLAVRWWIMEVLFLLPALSAETGSTATISASSDPAAIMRANPYAGNLRDLVTEKPSSSALKLGKSDYVLSGPLIEGIRRRPYTPERPALWKRIALFPLSLITPQPMAHPPGGGGGYFRWREQSTRPWSSVSASGVGSDTFINHEPKNAIISVSQP